VNPQQQWNGLQQQREAANQAAMHTQSSFVQAQNRPGLNAMNYGTNFPNPTPPQPAPDFNSMQSRQGQGMNQMGNPQPEQSAAIKENFLRFLQMQNVENRVSIAGRPIDSWELWHAVKKFDTTPGHPVRTLSLHADGRRPYLKFQANHPSKFHLIGAQLGLPTDPQSGQIPWMHLRELQDYYNRVSVALQNARNPQGRQIPFSSTNPNLGATLNAANQLALNNNMLQSVMKAYPHIDFGGITQDMVANLPSPRFESRIRSYITERQGANNGQVSGNTPHMPPRTPVPGPTPMNPRTQTPVGDPANTGLISRQPNMPPASFNVDEILKLHKQCQDVWRQNYDTLRTFIHRSRCT
jgi:hypothetical protein